MNKGIQVLGSFFYENINAAYKVIYLFKKSELLMKVRRYYCQDLSKTGHAIFAYTFYSRLFRNKERPEEEFLAHIFCIFS